VFERFWAANPVVCRLVLALLLLTVGGLVLADAGQVESTDGRSTSTERAAWHVLEDPSGALDGREALTQPPERWRELTGSALSPGHSRSAWWVRTTLDNRDSVAQRRILEVGWPLLDWLEVWIIRDGTVLERLSLGDRRPFDSRPLDTRTFAIPLEIPAGERREILLRLEMNNALFAPVVFRLWLPDEFWSRVQRDTLWAGVYFGALLALFAYNLLLFLATRDRNFLLYALYLGALTLWGFGFLGYGFQMLWPDGVWWQNQAYLARAAVTALASTFFVMSFLETRRRMPWVHGLLLLLGALVFVTLVVEISSWFGLAAPMAEALRAYVSLASLLFLAYLVAGLRALWLGVREARYFVLAWFFPVLGMLIFAVQDLADLVRRSPLANHSFEIGTLLECLLLALALGDRYQRLRDEKAALEQQSSGRTRGARGAAGLSGDRLARIAYSACCDRSDHAEPRPWCRRDGR
jgi:two-component system, sensor histidine kinase LadS